MIIDRLVTDGYIFLTDSKTDAPILSDKGYNFIGEGGYSEQARKKKLEKEKAKIELVNATRIKNLYYPLLAISVVLNAILIATNSITLSKVLYPSNSTELKPKADTIYIYSGQPKQVDSAILKK